MVDTNGNICESSVAIFVESVLKSKKQKEVERKELKRVRRETEMTKEKKIAMTPNMFDGKMNTQSLSTLSSRSANESAIDLSVPRNDENSFEKMSAIYDEDPSNKVKNSPTNSMAVEDASSQKAQFFPGDSVMWPQNMYRTLPSELIL